MTMTTTCRTCVTPIGYINCPTGGWWAHEKHPADNHDAVPAAWVDNDPLMETIAEMVWAHCRTEGTSLVVDDPRNIAATAAAVARHFAAAVPVPPPADQTASGSGRAAEAELYVLLRKAGEPRHEAQALLDRHRAEVLAVLPEQADRAAVLRWAADELGRMDYDTDNTDYGYDTYRDAWNGGVMDAAALLRRVAAEEQPAETQDGTTADKAAALGLTDTEYRARSHAAAVATIRAAIPGMYAHVGFRLEDVLNEADEVQPPETQAHEPTHTWTVESPRRDNWASWGTTYDDRDWALESYEHSTKNAPARPFRLVRATTTYTIEAEHTPPTARPAVGEQPETQEAHPPYSEYRVENYDAGAWQVIGLKRKTLADAQEVRDRFRRGYPDARLRIIRRDESVAVVETDPEPQP